MSNLLLAAPIPPDGRLQVWAHKPPLAISSPLQTRWKATSNPDSQWTAPWALFDPQPIPSTVLPFFDMTAGVLSDGRTQIWGIGQDFQVHTTWKLSTAHDSLWNNPWSVFDTTPITSPNFPEGISAAALPDKRLQLFIMDNNLQIWTAWKTTTDPNSPWTKLTIL